MIKFIFDSNWINFEYEKKKILFLQDEPKMIKFIFDSDWINCQYGKKIFFIFSRYANSDKIHFRLKLNQLWIWKKKFSIILSWTKSSRSHFRLNSDYEKNWIISSLVKIAILYGLERKPSSNLYQSHSATIKLLKCRLLVIIWVGYIGMEI
jgi:hypothetical protein